MLAIFGSQVWCSGILFFGVRLCVLLPLCYFAFATLKTVTVFCKSPKTELNSVEYEHDCRTWARLGIPTYERIWKSGTTILGLLLKLLRQAEIPVVGLAAPVSASLCWNRVVYGLPVKLKKSWNEKTKWSAQSCRFSTNSNHCAVPEQLLLLVDLKHRMTFHLCNHNPPCKKPVPKPQR